MSAYSFTASPLKKETINEWRANFEKTFPAAIAQKEDIGQSIMRSVFEMGNWPQFEACHNDEQLFGILTHYFHDHKMPHIQLLSFAVLSSHRKQGIGYELIQRTIKIAKTKKLPIVAAGVLPDAIPLLKKSGFWDIEMEDTLDTLYKWSNLPEHQNNKYPM